MSIFNQKSKFKVKTEVRTVRQAVEPKPKPKPNPSSATTSSSSATSRLHPPSSRRTGPSSSRTTPRASPNPASPYLSADTPATTNGRKRRAITSSRSPASLSFNESSGDEDGDEDWEAMMDARKRRKMREDQVRRVDLNRSLRHPRIWTGEEPAVSDKASAPPVIIHAVDVASLEEKCQPVLGLARDAIAVKLQYPGGRYAEKYVFFLSLQTSWNSLIWLYRSY